MLASRLYLSRRFELWLLLGWLVCAVAHGSELKHANVSPVAFDRQDTAKIRRDNLPEAEQNLIAKMPANFHHFGAARVGETADAEALTMRFQTETRLTRIVSTADFKVEQGGSCSEGNIYEAKSTCTLLVRFTPRGPGHRVGKLTVDHSAGAQSLTLGLTGYGYSPVVSFTPALISTVPGTYPSSKGLLSNVFNLGVDGGDGLYIPDFGNGLLRYMDSSGAITTIAGGGSTPITGTVFGAATSFKLSGPLGVAIDGFDNAYVSDDGDGEVLLVNITDSLSTFVGGGEGSPNCSECSPTGVSLGYLDGVALDPSGNPFFIGYELNQGELGEVVSSTGLLMGSLNYPLFAGYSPLIDGEDNIYLAPYNSSYCNITGENSAYANHDSGGTYWIVAGTRTCGFSGDGGQARNAEIGKLAYQMVFDLAGNLYFSDVTNQRVRRIDAATGIIHTIAGTGSFGYTGDGGPATSATLGTPTGVVVDSQGQVYIACFSGTNGINQVIRKLGPNGALTFASQLKGSASAAKTVTVANTGNEGLAVTKVVITGADAGDFSMDPNTTSCNFAVNQDLSSGQSCLIGVIFKPTAGGTRTANLVLLDNTVTNSNTVQLTGTGTLPAATVKIMTPAARASFTSGKTIPFTVDVTSAGAPAPTGTVQFSVDGTKVGSAVKVSSGAATINLTGLSAKTHTVAAAYSGDTNYAAATASESITVIAATAGFFGNNPHS